MRSGDLLYDILLFAGIVAALLGLYLFLFNVIKYRARKKERTLPRALKQYLYMPGLLLVFIGVSLSLFPILREYFSPGMYGGIHHFLKILTIAAVGFFLIRTLSFLRELAFVYYKRKNEEDTRFRSLKTQFLIIQRVVTTLIIFATAAAILTTFPGVKNIGTTLFASAGIVGIILGFAAQKSLGALFGGIQIAIAQPIRIGDVVVVEEEFGTIGEINLTFVVVDIWDGRRLIVPVNYFLEQSFESWTRVSPDVVSKVKIYADYSIPVDELRTELKKWLDKTELWDKRKWALLVTDADDSGIELRATMSAKNSDDAWDLECLIREKLIAYIQKSHPEALPKTRVMLNGKENIHEELIGSDGKGRVH